MTRLLLLPVLLLSACGSAGGAHPKAHLASIVFAPIAGSYTATCTSATGYAFVPGQHAIVTIADNGHLTGFDDAGHSVSVYLSDYGGGQFLGYTNGHPDERVTVHTEMTPWVATINVEPTSAGFFAAWTLIPIAGDG